MMTAMTHPRLVEALRSLREEDDAGPILAVALNARRAQEEGRYCECDVAECEGLDLMCGACLLNNRDQEIAAVKRLVDVHDFVRSSRSSLLPMCEVCTGWEDWPRHHGVPAVGRTSWGAEVQGV